MHYIEEVNELLNKKDRKAISAWLFDHHPNDIATVIDELEMQKAAVLFRALPKAKAVDVFSYLETEAQISLLQGFTDEEVTRMLEDLYTDDAVDLIEELPANVVTRVLELATPQTRATINNYLKYPEDSAGSIMTTEYIHLRADMTVGEAIAYIRTYGHNKETIYTAYITTPHRRLKGVLSVRNLLMAKNEEFIADIMEETIISASTTDDQEHVVHLFSDYDLIALPVVDGEDRLVGIITIDDVLDVSEEEATEDFERMAAITPSEGPYMKTSVLEQVKNRFPWLLFLMISGILNGFILARYEHAYLAIPLLVTFVPMLTGTGGNAGAQSSTMVIRGLSLEEIQFSDWLQVLWRELRISLIVGVVLASVNFVRVYFTYGRNLGISLVVSLSLIGVVILAKVMGSMLPLLAKKIHVDPATMAAPLITTVVDAGGLILFFTISEILLQI